MFREWHGFITKAPPNHTYTRPEGNNPNTASMSSILCAPVTSNPPGTRTTPGGWPEAD